MRRRVFFGSIVGLGASRAVGAQSFEQRREEFERCWESMTEQPGKLVHVNTGGSMLCAECQLFMACISIEPDGGRWVCRNRNCRDYGVVILVKPQEAKVVDPPKCCGEVHEWNMAPPPYFFDRLHQGCTIYLNGHGPIECDEFVRGGGMINCTAHA